MILTYKVKHNEDFSLQLRQAKLVANFSIKNRDKLSTKHVASIGLKAAISNQILRKYGRNKKCKKVSSVKLIIPGLGVQYKEGIVKISCLKFQFPFDKTKCLPFEKINQIEIDSKWCYISVEVREEPQQQQLEGYIGVDRNTTGHCCVAACTKTGKVMFLGKKAQHIHTKYSKIRKKLQKRGKRKKLKAIRRRESNITKDLNHKISRKLVNYSLQTKCGIKLEKLEGIRKRAKQAKSFKYSLNSWSYYQLQTMIDYKAQLAGVSVTYIDPAYTSKTCSKCGVLGNRSGKSFKCPRCGHTSHADSNAAWNIAKSEKLWELNKKQNSDTTSVCYSSSNCSHGHCKKEIAVKGVLVPRYVAPAKSLSLTRNLTPRL